MIQAIFAALTVFDGGLLILFLMHIFSRWDQGHRVVNRIRRINPS